LLVEVMKYITVGCMIIRLFSEIQRFVVREVWKLVY
jgi:hypothetical protein